MKKKTFRVHTTCTTGWVYEVTAKNKKEAKDKLYSGEYLNDYEDMDWCGDSQEEVDFVEEVKKGGKVR